MARGCALIDSRLDTAKIGSDGRVEVHRARLLAVFGGTKNVSTRPGPTPEVAPLTNGRCHVANYWGRKTHISRRMRNGSVEPYSLPLVIAESRSSIAEGVAADARSSRKNRPANRRTQGGGAIRDQLNTRGG